VAVGVRTFESTVIYPINRNKARVFLFFIYDTSETITAMETVPPNMAVVCLTSISVTGDRGSTVVLRYKSEGLWFDSRWCHWNFSLT